jgi:(4S)-4-hydroxy-5-phosphonooxypentane-2,3-dione isomerase
MPMTGLEHGVESTGMETQFAITVEFRLRPEGRDRFLGLVRANAATSVEREPGCTRFDILTPTADGAQPIVLLYEIYRSRAAFEAHLATPHFAEFDQATRSLILQKTVVEFAVSANAKP